MDRRALSHDEVADDLPAYLLGALDDEGCEAVAAHLATCPVCQRERARLEATIGALATLAPVADPPTHLRDRLLARLDADADGSPPTPQDPPAAAAPAPVSRLDTPRWMRFALAAAAVLIVGLGIALALIARDLAHVRSDLAELREEQQMAAAALTGAARAIPLVSEGATHAYGTLYVSEDDHEALLVVTEIPPTPDGRVYQVWLREGEARTSAGIFTVDDSGRAVLRLQAPRPIADYQAMGITEEPGPTGSPGPTSPPLATCSLS